jgi:hypothetical protein
MPKTVSSPVSSDHGDWLPGARPQTVKQYARPRNKSGSQNPWRCGMVLAVLVVLFAVTHLVASHAETQGLMYHEERLGAPHQSFPRRRESRRAHSVLRSKRVLLAALRVAHKTQRSGPG